MNEETPVVEIPVIRTLGQEGEVFVAEEGPDEVIVYDYDAKGVVIGSHKEVVE